MRKKLFMTLFALAVLIPIGAYAASMVMFRGVKVKSNVTVQPSPYNKYYIDNNGLVGWWTFDEGTGSTTRDMSGNGNNGTWNGTPTGTSGYYSPGKVGQWAGAFDGSTDYISLGKEIAITTLSFWLNPSVALSKTIVYDSVAGNTIQGYGGSNVWEVYDGSSHLFSQGATLNQWHYYAFIYDGVHYNLYIDGVYQGQVTANRINMNFIGRNINYPADGLLDDVRVYNRALSASEIAAMFSYEQNNYK